MAVPVLEAPRRDPASLAITLKGATGLTITPATVVDGVTVTTTITPALQATLTRPTGQAVRAEAEIEHDPAATGQGRGRSGRRRGRRRLR
ncbi:hypothetical protein GCM10027612_48750 [Microbispora bryophytorum subsp. camponoti]